MDVSVNPVLESVRPFFQGLPANNTTSPATSVGSSLPSHPAVATPVQPSQHGFQNNPPSNIPSSSPSVLSYWPLSGSQRTKEPQSYVQSPSAKSPALASPLHHVYNGTKLSEPLQPAAHQPEIQRHQHNLPPIAALSSNMGYQHSRAARDLAASQGALLHRQPHRPLPSINQITPHSSVKTSTSSVSPRMSQSQFRAPDYPQSNHHSIYSPSSSSNQSHSRSSSSSSYQSQMLASKYQPSPGSPAVSSPSPHPYSYSPRTSLPMSSVTTASSPVYPQTTSASSVYVSSSHHHRQQLQNAQLQQSSQSRLPNQQHQSHHPMSPVIQQPSQPELYGHLKLHHQHPCHNQQPAHGQHSSSQQQPSHSQHSSGSQQPSHNQHSSSHQHSSPIGHQQTHPQHPSGQPQAQQTHSQHSSSQSQQSHSQHISSKHVSQQQAHAQQAMPPLQHQGQQSLPGYQQQHKSAAQLQQAHNIQQMLHQQSQSQQQIKHEQPQHHQQSMSRSQQSTSQQLLAQQHQQLQQQAALYNQSIQQNTRQNDDVQQTHRMKQRQQLAAQQQPYYAPASSSNSSRPSSQTTTTTATTLEGGNHQRTTTTQSLSGGLKRESPLDLSVKTVRQSADSTAKDDSESMYLTNYQAHEALQNRSKQPIKTTSPRNSAVLPPLQLPSTVVYPHFDNHSTSQIASSGAPKVDFLPNFNAHHSSTTGSSTNFQDSSKRQRKSSTSQLPSPSQYPPHMGSLPHMGSFKKSSLPSAAYDDPNKQSQYYPATGPPGIQRSVNHSTNHASLNMQAAFPATPNNQFPYDPSKRGSSARYDFLDRRNSSLSSAALQSASSAESNYALGKRQSSSDLRQPLPPKIPRVVDTWRQTIDQQIEQRLNSYASSRGHQINGTTKENSLNNDSILHQQNVLPFSSASSSSIQTSLSGTALPPNNSLINRSSLFSSHRSNSSSSKLMSSQYYPSNQPQYQSLTVPPRPSTQDPYSNLSQVKLPALPSNGAADKRVLSILRKRLDTREATNQMVQQQQQQQQQTHSAHLQERAKMYSSLAPRPSYSQPLVVPSPVITSQNKSSSQLPLGRHNLPPFNALNLERNSSMSYSSPKLHIPKAMDSVVPEHSQNNSQSRGDVISRSPVPSRTETSTKPSAGENSADFDGLAAFLAARIRTKAELKQVGPSMEQQRIPTPVSGSNSSAQSPRTTPGIFSPPPSVQMHYPAVPGDFGKGTPLSESDRASSSGPNSSSPMKCSRDRYGINSPRRRLFYRPDDESGGTSEGVIQAREVGLRSSSETSVFDFRESDSDGETASERQSLNEMRKDRDRRLQEKHQTVSVPSPEPTSATPMDGATEPIDDSFWSGICDQFVNQLEKGGNKVKKIGRRKKLIYTPLDSFEPIETYEQYEEIKSDTSCSVDVPEIKQEIIKSEKDTEIKKEEPNEETKELIPKEESIPVVKQSIKVEEESSDEDVPLSLRQNELKKVKEVSIKTENSSCEEKVSDKDKSECDNLSVIVEKNKDFLKDDCSKQNIKKEVSDSEAESSADESIESVAKRLRIRKTKEEPSENKRKTRSGEKENSGTPKKGGRRKKGEKKKSLYGDGSEFRPGWEAEVYRYKRSLRMPARLINIAGPQSWPRLSVSLPDLDPDSPMTLDSEISLQNKKFESDGESTPIKTKPTDSPKSKHSQKKVEEKGEEDSFINRLIQRYGGKGKKSLRKGQEKDSSKERKGPKIIPQSTELQLLPTPSLDCIVKTPKKSDLSAPPSKQTRGKKSKDGEKSGIYDGSEAIYLGYFRKKTVADFRDAFAKHNGGFATEHELPPIMLKSRTRTQTRILTQRATIREVFGEDRPASAPPAGCRDDETEENEKSLIDDKKSKKSCMKSKVLLNKRNSSSGMSIGTRSGLRSAFVLRSNKAILKSKQQLLHGGARRKRSKDLIKAYTTGKKPQDPGGKESAVEEPIFKFKPPATVTKVKEVPVLVSEKRLKYRSVRRKLKSSGFDYIRKKKKQQQKKEGETESVKEKKKAILSKSNLESEEDIQNEIKGWVINKGLGETVLHRAARLGYTDIAAYCLEKMDHNPSPRDNAGYTPLHEACSKGRLDIARLLLLYGADVSDSAQGGIRPLHEAAENGSLELMRLLLSYGADPQLATYSGHTPLSLTYNNPEAKALLQNHLSDVQGLNAHPWQLQLTDSTLLGYDPTADPPSPDPSDCDVEVESGELSLPHLYQLLGEPHTDRWVLFQELGPVLKVKTREALIKQLGPNHRNDFRDLKMTDFYDMARCCSIMGVGDYTLNPKAHKVTLVKYSERVRALLNSEKLMITAR